MWALVMTTLASFVAVSLSPGGLWRRLYVTSTVALAGVTFLTLNVLIDLSLLAEDGDLLRRRGAADGRCQLRRPVPRSGRQGQRSGHGGVVAGWFAGDRATGDRRRVPPLRRARRHRFSALDEMGLFLVTVALLVTGYSWQIKSTTFFGGVALILYLMIIVVSLGWQQQLAAGVYLAVGGPRCSAWESL